MTGGMLPTFEGNRLLPPPTQRDVAAGKFLTYRPSKVRMNWGSHRIVSNSYTQDTDRPLFREISALLISTHPSRGEIDGKTGKLTIL